MQKRRTECRTSKTVVESVREVRKVQKKCGGFREICVLCKTGMKSMNQV